MPGRPVVLSSRTLSGSSASAQAILASSDTEAAKRPARIRPKAARGARELVDLLSCATATAAFRKLVASAPLQRIIAAYWGLDGRGASFSDRGQLLPPRTDVVIHTRAM